MNETQLNLIAAPAAALIATNGTGSGNDQPIQWQQ
jgi:hypothetical protein